MRNVQSHFGYFEKVRLLNIQLPCRRKFCGCGFKKINENKLCISNVPVYRKLYSKFKLHDYKKKQRKFCYFMIYRWSMTQWNVKIVVFCYYWLPITPVCFNLPNKSIILGLILLNTFNFINKFFKYKFWFLMFNYLIHCKKEISSLQNFGTQIYSNLTFFTKFF